AIGIFHIFTHAFFKALLFFAAGSLIHAAHSNDIRQMGNMGKFAKVTSICFLIGSLALCGLPPFAGFFSKDAIIHSAHIHGFTGLYFIAILTAFLTSLYMARCLVYVFLGEYRGKGTPQESSNFMTFPLIVLAAFSISLGFIQEDFTLFLSAGQIHMEALNMSAYLISTSTVFCAFVLSYLIFHRKIISPEAISKSLIFPHFVLNNKYFIDQIWSYFLQNVVFSISWICATFDKKVVDEIFIDGWDSLTHSLAKVLKKTQTGIMHTYLLVGLMSTVIFIFTLVY
ncbi:hypothetical protein MJH12_20065, partial [bacterium]|nr:hypothetical protein [bacterium]